jgi:hypothetical protein
VLDLPTCGDVANCISLLLVREMARLEIACCKGAQQPDAGGLLVRA